MENNLTPITIEATVKSPIEKVWDLFTNPTHITKWSSPSDDWHTTYAENDLRAGGKFLSKMATKDGSFGFDFGGVYDEVKTNQFIAYTLGDGRKVSITFKVAGGVTTITEIFQAEDTHPVDFQRGGWQAILNNFKKYAEAGN